MALNLVRTYKSYQPWNWRLLKIVKRLLLSWNPYDVYEISIQPANSVIWIWIWKTPQVSYTIKVGFTFSSLRHVIMEGRAFVDTCHLSIHSTKSNFVSAAFFHLGFSCLFTSPCSVCWRLRLFEIAVAPTSVNKSSPPLNISSITHLPPLLHSTIEELKVFNSLQLILSPKLAI